MTYLEINKMNLSKNVSSLKINKRYNYNSQTNAAGNTVIDYINSKVELEVGIIPLNSRDMASFLSIFKNMEVDVSYLNPETAQLKTIKCIIPDRELEYYRISNNQTLFKEFTIKLIEL